jgi:glycosyltransferase involved in cell wall biosynthesis
VAAIRPEVDLVMAGPDPTKMRSALHLLAERHGVAERIHWPGLVGGDVKWGAIRASEAFVLPSHQENFGIAVVEALAVGRPVLISNQVNIWSEIDSDRVGLVEDDTLEGTERLLRRWFGLLPAERDNMADRARSTFISRYTTNQSALAINRLFAPREVGISAR